MICCGHLRVYALLTAVVVYCFEGQLRTCVFPAKRRCGKNARLGRVPPELTDIPDFSGAQGRAMDHSGEAGAASAALLPATLKFVES